MNRPTVRGHGVGGWGIGGRGLPLKNLEHRKWLVVALLVTGVWLMLHPAYPVIAMPNPGPCTVGTPVLGIEVIDDSGSTRWTDPGDKRYVESRVFTKWVARYRCTTNDRVAVVHFGNRSVTAGPDRLSNGARSILASLAGPNAGTGSGTLLMPAIASTRQIIERFKKWKIVVILETDGGINDGRTAFRSLRGLGAPVYAVAIGGQLGHEWRRARLAHVEVLSRTTRVGQVAGALGRIWVRTTHDVR